MNRPTSYEKFHWALFNTIIRIMGGGFILFSVMSAVTLLLANDLGGEYSTSESKIIFLIACPLTAALGWLLLKVKPYYPKQYEEYYKNIGKIKEDTVTN